MITWKQTGWAERAWGYQVYLYLVDKDTVEQFNEAPGFDHMPSEIELWMAAQTIIARILQGRIDRAVEMEAMQEVKVEEELAAQEAVSVLQGRVKELEGQLEEKSMALLDLMKQVATLQEAKLEPDKPGVAVEKIG